MFFPGRDVTTLDATSTATIFEGVSHIVALPILWILWRDRRYYMATVLSSVLVSSLMYHLCRGDYYCFGLGATSSVDAITGALLIPGLENARFLDHVSASYAFAALILVVLTGDHGADHWLIAAKFILLIATLWTELAFPYQFEGLVILYAVTGMVVVGLFFFQSDFHLPRARQFRPGLFLTGVAIGASGLTFFFLDGGLYDILHPIWHVCIFVAAFLIVASVDRQRVHLPLPCDGPLPLTKRRGARARAVGVVTRPTK